MTLPQQDEQDKAKLNQAAQQAVENSTIIVGRKVKGEWQLAVLLQGVFEKTVQKESLLEAMNDALAKVYEREFKDGDRIQFKIDVVTE